jgi:hypothetical protein
VRSSGLFRTGGIDNVTVPEPASAALLATDVAILIVRRRKWTRAGMLALRKALDRSA